MEYSDILGKLSHPEEANPDAEFSISQALSLPVDFLVSFVKNRREAELLLKVSKSAASLDLLTRNYEMIALRTQELQEAWDGLWLAQEPYIIPAIPLLGTEMSGVNRGRSMLLEKMDKEINNLQELGKQLRHYIDVNYSLVEELHMEGIERLAISKLLLVEVERELARRITHISSNKSVRDLSSIRHFLCHLSRKPASVGMAIDAVDQNEGHVDNMTNGSCSTEKITTDGSSEGQQRSVNNASEDRDAMSLDSQSFASKCVATQGDNMHPPSNTRYIGVSVSNKILDYQDWPSDLSGRSNKGIPPGSLALTGALDIKPDVRNQSSSASEERLPKVSSSGNGHDELPQATVGDDIKKKEFIHYKYYEGAEQDVANCSSRKMPADRGGKLDHHVKKHLHCESEKGLPIRKAEMGTSAGCSKLDLIHEQGQVEHREGSSCDHPAENLANDVADQTSTGQDLYQPLEDRMSEFHNQDFQAFKPDARCDSRKRPSECAHSIGDTLRKKIDMVERNSKRIQASSESERATIFVRTNSLREKETFEQHNEGTNHGFLSSASHDKAGEVDTTRDSKDETSLIPCSCDQQNNNTFTDSLSALQSKPLLTQGRCRDCGCLLSQVCIRHSRDVINRTSSFNVEDSKELGLVEASAIQVPESPILATQ